MSEDEATVEHGPRLIQRVRLRSTGSPSPSSMVIPSVAGHSKSAPSAVALHYASLSQRTTWLEEEEDVGFAFEEYRAKRKSSLDLSADDIMDLTADSPFLEQIDDDKEVHVIIKDLPKLTNEFIEMQELDSLLGEQCSYEALQDKVFNTPPNTDVRRFLFRVVDSYSRYFSKCSDIPKTSERQVTFDLLSPFIRGALQVFDVESDLGEIAIIGTGERRNANRDLADKLDKCKRADITGKDTRGNQVFLGECSMLYEKDVRKKVEDRWKLVRSMKDSWDSAIKKFAESHRPHGTFSTFGLQFFDQKLTFLKLDYRGHYRVWQVDSCDLPVQTSDFYEKADICCRSTLRFARAVAEEIRQRKKLPALSPCDVLLLRRAANKLTPTTMSPDKKKTV
ncbi:hypothetical protein EC968_004981 [Mortierella alpina]|nr:hypothetical protein EC968_004981 [Mortierella alpina]